MERFSRVIVVLIVACLFLLLGNYACAEPTKNPVPPKAPPVQDSDCTGAAGCECWKYNYACPRDHQGGCRCGTAVIDPRRAIGPAPTPGRVDPGSAVLGASVNEYRPIPAGYAVITSGPDVGKLIPLSNFTHQSAKAAPRSWVTGQGHTHTCSQCGTVWDHGANPTHTCPTCGASQFRQDAVPKAAYSPRFSLPVTGGCANGKCAR